MRVRHARRSLFLCLSTPWTPAVVTYAAAAGSPAIIAVPPEPARRCPAPSVARTGSAGSWRPGRAAPGNRAGAEAPVERGPHRLRRCHGGMRRPTDCVPPGSSPRRGNCRARSLATNARRPSRRPLPRRTMRLGLPWLGAPVDIAVATGSARVAGRAVAERADGIGGNSRRTGDAEGGRIRRACSLIGPTDSRSWRRTVRRGERDPAADVRPLHAMSTGPAACARCRHRAGQCSEAAAIEPQASPPAQGARFTSYAA